jgi:DNA mismatch repair protein MutS2
VCLVPEARLELERARHPLLLLSGIDVVANDLRIEGGRALVISGPNAGGKTVALKTLGLVAMMARAGIPLPVSADSVVGWFDRVLAEVGDEQSIVRSLSTFSAHVQNLCEVLELSGPHTLILLDELAAGTDPEEGAALAAAVLEALTARGAAVVVTTHYERLKELAANAPHLENASVSFDFSAMAPTFRLTLGVPGASSALLVAKRHGLSDAVIERAKALLPKESVDREQALNRLERERAALEAERYELARQTELLAQQRADFEVESEAEREALHTEIQREASAIRATVLKARGELERARRSLREQGLSAEGVKQAERSVSRVAGQVAVGGELFEKGKPAESPRSALDVQALGRGQVVRIKSIGALATVSEVLEAGTVRLVAGSMKLTLPVSELELAPAGVKAARSASKKISREKRPLIAAPIRTEDNTLDLRGVRVEDAETLIDAFLDRMLGQGEPTGFVLHGHGTGALKLAVRAHLAASSYVEHSRAADPDAGGDAFTVFWIKD